MPRSKDRSGSLLYDEDCALCVATAGWLGRRVDPDRLRLLALGEAVADRRISGLVEGRRLSVTLHFVRSDDNVLTGAHAVLAAGRLVPRWRLLARLCDHRVGQVLLEPLYRQIAAHRRLVGRMLRLPAACPLPSERRLR